MENNNIKTCMHENVVWGKKWFGVFPKTQYGVCKDCGKQMIKLGDIIKEKEDKIVK
jgi:hypothetical protein